MSHASPKRPFDNKLFIFSAILIFSSLFLMGQYARTVKKADDDQFFEFTSMFAEVYKEVKERYVEPVDSKKLFEGALQGMFLTLDPHSQYMDPDSYNQLEKDTEGAFSGIGIHITLKDGVLTVIAPIPSSPSAKAGVKPWDRIIEIDGKKTEGITLIDAVKKLTGPEGTTVNVTIYREGEGDLLHFTLTRKNVKVESIYFQMIENTPIGYVRVTKFSDNTGRDLRKAVDHFKEKGAKGVIVDLRYNTGGLLKEAVETSNLFLQRGKLVVSTKGRMKNQNQELRCDNDAATDLPLVVLINKGSASASEIFAGAMKDHGRGIVLGIKGQRSFGKGSVQTIEELNHSFEKDDNGNYRPAAIRLTTAKYYTPSGISIDKIGVTPDVAVEMPKGAETELLKHGMFGDPATEEDDQTSSKSRFSWNQKPADKDSTVSLIAPGSDKDPSMKGDEDKDEDSIMGSAVVGKDADTTGPKPKRVVLLDKNLAPDAEPEGATKKPEPKKKDANAKFLDYQLEIAKRLMVEHITKGRDFLAPEPGETTGSKTLVDAKDAAGAGVTENKQ
ncbi:MAG: S41 family peptidase [Candidatus Sumerlaeaceae bacterium]